MGQAKVGHQPQTLENLSQPAAFRQCPGLQVRPFPDIKFHDLSTLTSTTESLLTAKGETTHITATPLHAATSTM